MYVERSRNKNPLILSFFFSFSFSHPFSSAIVHHQYKQPSHIYTTWSFATPNKKNTHTKSHTYRTNGHTEPKPISKAPEGEGCPRCGGFVYMAEQMLARGRVSFFFYFYVLLFALLLLFFSLLMHENAAFYA